MSHRSRLIAQTVILMRRGQRDASETLREYAHCCVESALRYVPQYKETYITSTDRAFESLITAIVAAYKRACIGTN